MLGAPLPAPAPQWYYIEDIPKPLGEAVTFEYRYRSYHALQITGLIPRSPSAEAEKPPDSVHRLGTRANLGAIGDNTNAEITALRVSRALCHNLHLRGNSLCSRYIGAD